MGSFKIKGGNKLNGELTPQGAKNEALQVVCAVLLTPEKVTLHNLPDIRDVNFLIDLLEELGVKVERKGKGTVHFTSDNINLDYLLSDQFKKAYMPKPGGDKIGARPLDTHFLGFEKLGATYSYDSNSGFYTLKADNLTGKYILLDEPSVTGTAN